MKVAWFDCQAGASGDMFLGALVDAGAPLSTLQAAVDAVGVEPVRLERRAVTRQGIAATKVDVQAPPSDVTRTWADIRGLLERAPLDDAVRARSLDVFARLARAEAAAHGIGADEVHFHEVGALDAIADVVASCAGLWALGISEAVASSVTLGSGTASGAHGVVPVPGPAVLALLAEAGAPVQSGPSAAETCTPTGAALLAATVSAWGGLPLMTVTATGVGAGSRDDDGIANVLRVVIGDRVDVDGSTEAVVLSANVDDLDPRLWPAVLARLLDAGADDAWLTPILMKKGRPAHTLSVLTDRGRAESLRRVVFTETSTIGLREQVVTKHALARELRTVDVDGESVRVKVALLDGAVVNATPEFDDVVAAASRLGRPVKSVLAAASAVVHAASPTS
ncbi:MAG: pyridinium-3,5-bisthiocarboxylic acid mononucleotide nickel chelatase [Actinomycetota bacterium]|nr:pyridinium-3,5-bisthiocarboxylic acid mononucleotide nickel chelatase [Actinomycetota bacterium]